MKVGLLADIHCNVEGLRQALAELDDCDEVVCAGDLLYQYRFSNETLELLWRRGVRAIVGNHDKAILHAPHHPLRSSPSVDPRWLEYLAQLPDRLMLTLGGTRLLVVHGVPWDDPTRMEATYLYPHDVSGLRRLRDVEADVVVLGHTHVPMVVQEGHVLVVNPGSCGVPNGMSAELSCASLDMDTGRVEFRQFRASHVNGGG